MYYLYITAIAKPSVIYNFILSHQDHPFVTHSYHGKQRHLTTCNNGLQYSWLPMCILGFRSPSIVLAWGLWWAKKGRKTTKLSSCSGPWASTLSLSSGRTTLANMTQTRHSTSLRAASDSKHPMQLLEAYRIKQGDEKTVEQDICFIKYLP